MIVGEGETFDGGGATYTVPPGVLWPGIEVRSGATLKNVKLTTLYNSSEGVLVNGDNTTVQNVETNRFRFGIRVDDSDDVLIEDCNTHHSRLDGLKLRKMATNIHIRNCDSQHNGQDWPTNAGDGIDTYAGGMGVLIEDCNFSNNKGNGVTTKTDSDNRDEPEVYGIPTDTTVRRCVCNFNMGSGLTAYAFPLDDETIPLYEYATFEDCECRSNGNYGVLINADHVTATNIQLDSNGLAGVWIGARSGEDITLDNVTGQGVTDLRE